MAVFLPSASFILDPELMCPIMQAFRQAKIKQLQTEPQPSLPSPGDETELSDLPLSPCLVHKLHALADIFDRASAAHEKSFSLRPHKRSLDPGSCHVSPANTTRQRTEDYIHGT